MSDFFAEPAPPADLPAPAPARIPPWISAPQGTLPGVVPLELLLARTDRIAVCVTRVAAYPSGFEVDLLRMSGGEDDDLDPMPFGGHLRRRRPAQTGDETLPDMLRFGVEFADGRKATNTSRVAFDFGFDTEPKGAGDAPRRRRRRRLLATESLGLAAAAGRPARVRVRMARRRARTHAT